MSSSRCYSLSDQTSRPASLFLFLVMVFGFDHSSVAKRILIYRDLEITKHCFASSDPAVTDSDPAVSG